MIKYIDLDLQVLMDLLVRHTNEYTTMLADKIVNGEEFAQCKRTLSEIQQAAKLKIEQGGHLMNNVVTNVTDFVIDAPDNPVNTDSGNENFFKDR